METPNNGWVYFSLSTAARDEQEQWQKGEHNEHKH